MDPEQRYLFDLNGYLTIPDAIGPDALAALNRYLDQRLAGEMAPEDASKRFGGMLHWDAVFRAQLTCPAVLPVLDEILGPGFRLDHSYLDVIRGGTSPIGASLHGGGTPFDPAQYYQVHDGRIHCGLTVVAFNLADVGPGDGGFACVPGSHKANFAFPSNWRDLHHDHPCVRRVIGPAGTAIVFTEALTHGPLPWTAAHERRTLFFKYCPAPVAYSRRYPDAEGFADLDQRGREILSGPGAIQGKRRA